jgi:hypothetical protein
MGDPISLVVFDGRLVRELRRLEIGSLSPGTLGDWKLLAPEAFAAFPIGVDLISPPILTSCLADEDLEASTLPLFTLWALDLFNSTIQAGWFDGGGVVVLGLGASVFRAFSSQLSLVGLHLRVSMVLDGLVGGVFSSSS